MSTTALPDLWPDDIRVDVLPPVILLRAQLKGLARRTDGRLEADVSTVTGVKDFVIHRLDITAPQLGGERHRVLTATHRTAFYPVVVEAETYRPAPPRVAVAEDFGRRMAKAFGSNPDIHTTMVTTDPDRWPHPDDWRPVAATQEELAARIRDVFHSPPVRAMMESLLARTHEKMLADEEAAVKAVRVPMPPTTTAPQPAPGAAP